MSTCENDLLLNYDIIVAVLGHMGTELVEALFYKPEDWI
jgi:hypothetical protein